MILHHLGFLLDSDGRWYAFWSGFGSDLTEFAIVGMVYNRLVCHEVGCWRLGKHHLADTPLTLCRKHHPEVN